MSAQPELRVARASSLFVLLATRMYFQHGGALDSMAKSAFETPQIREGEPQDMVVVTSRTDLEKLIVLRLREAKLLLDQQDWDGAYYLAGYAVEFALKIRIISELMKSDSFPEKKLAENFYKHGLSDLRKFAGLEKECRAHRSECRSHVWPRHRPRCVARPPRAIVVEAVRRAGAQSSGPVRPIDREMPMQEIRTLEEFQRLVKAGRLIGITDRVAFSAGRGNTLSGGEFAPLWHV